MTAKESVSADKKVTSLAVENTQDKKPVVKKHTGKNRRKSRELVMKAVYRGMLNQSDMSAVLRDMTEDPDYGKADEAYFKFLLEAVTRHVVAVSYTHLDVYKRQA